MDQAPEVLRKVEPVYPYPARRQKLSGKVVVEFLVDRDGGVSKPAILEAHPSGIFEESALKAIRQWRFKAGCYHGKAVPTWIILPMQFKLTE